MARPDDFEEVLEATVRRLQDMGFEADLRAEYSGRGMFGKTVPGIVTRAPGVLVGLCIAGAVIEVASGGIERPDPEDIDFVDYQLRHEDGMGLSTIYY